MGDENRMALGVVTSRRLLTNPRSGSLYYLTFTNSYGCDTEAFRNVLSRVFVSLSGVGNLR